MKQSGIAIVLGLVLIVFVTPSEAAWIKVVRQWQISSNPDDYALNGVSKPLTYQGEDIKKPASNQEEPIQVTRTNYFWDKRYFDYVNQWDYFSDESGNRCETSNDHIIFLIESIGEINEDPDFQPPGPILGPPITTPKVTRHFDRRCSVPPGEGFFTQSAGPLTIASYHWVEVNHPFKLYADPIDPLVGEAVKFRYTAPTSEIGEWQLDVGETDQNGNPIVFSGSSAADFENVEYIYTKENPVIEAALTSSIYDGGGQTNPPILALGIRGRSESVSRNIGSRIPATTGLVSACRKTIPLDASKNETADDCDGDGLLNAWELKDHGVDGNGDGEIDLELYKLGANFKKQDIFIEIDYSGNNEPTQSALSEITKIFASHEITVHFEDEKLMDVIEEPFDFGGLKEDSQKFLAIKYGSGDCVSGAFGTIKQKLLDNCGNVIKAKSKAYHYAIFIDSILKSNGKEPLGQGIIGSNNIVIALGRLSSERLQNHGGNSNLQSRPNSNTNLSNKAYVQAAVLMHEIGHNLGLRHGGNVNELCKPNYQSIMNYTYTTRLYDAGGILNYSDKNLNVLDEENGLSEPDGIKGGADGRYTVFIKKDSNINTPDQVSASAMPIDWNHNGDPREIEIRNFDLNKLQPPCLTNNDYVPVFSTLTGFDDWGNIKLKFAVDNFTSSEGFNIFPDEPGLEELEVAALSIDYDNDGFANLDDNCPSNSNPLQEDGDFDGVGDICDNCLIDSNPGQDDADADLVGDICDLDSNSLSMLLPSNHWEQIAIPSNVFGVTISQLFGDDLETNEYGTAWVVYGYNGAIRAYELVALNESLELGKGYWMIQLKGQDVTIDLPLGFNETPLRKTDDCVSESGCFEINMNKDMNNTGKPFWTMLGNPFSTPTKLGDTFVRYQSRFNFNNNGVYQYGSDVSNLYIADTMFHYDSSLRDYRLVTSEDELAPWEGAWAAAFESYAAHVIRILIPDEEIR